MKRQITSIPQMYRNVKRWTEILSILSKYGLANWISRLNIDFVKDKLKASDGEALARQSHETRVRMALAELGPTFIKLGQLMSTRPDIVGQEQAKELQLLQSDTPADSFEQIREIVESELGQSIEEVFAAFDEKPIASASIGQVHSARLHSGERVVVKVQHHGIENTINNDLEILAGLAQWAEMLDELKPYRPAALVAEMARTMRRELDFGREERNLQQFASLFDEDPEVRIPQPYTEYCTARVLTMELLEGINSSEPKRLLAQGVDLTDLSRRCANLYLRMIFNEGFYHADPHPGNILILRGGVVGLLDFGMVGRISERLREDIEEMLLAIVNHDVAMLTTILSRVGSLPPDLDENAFSNDVADYVGQYATQSMERFDMSGALNDMMETVRRNHISMPAEAATLIKALVTLEGTMRLLSPDFSLMELMVPFQRTLLLRRMSPLRQAKKLRRFYMQMEQMAEQLPQRLSNIVEQIQTGRFDVHLDHRRLGPSVNRLVMGMMTSALFLGSSMMLSWKVQPLLWVPEGWNDYQLSVLGLCGSAVSILIGVRLIWAIRKSGNLDR